MTLHLARAIQAANPPIPNVELERYASSSESPSDDSSKSTISTSEDSRAVWEEWRRSRRAIVHSVEISPIYSKHAERKVVAGFRRGLYSPHIDFHVSNVNDWVANQLRCRNHEAFLSYVFLDMPSCHRYLQKVATAMKEDGLIAVFTPSITQLGDCIREIKANALPLKMEKALELGDGISNGRLWDIRLTVKKATDPIDDLQRNSEGEGDDHKETQQEADTQNETPSMVSSEENLAIPSQKASSTDDFSIDKAVMVCRPKVGERVIGGGFVGLWRKTPSK